jgi:integrase
VRFLLIPVHDTTSARTHLRRRQRRRCANLPESAERRPDPADETRALQQAEIERLLTRRDVTLREKTLWRMLYETAARASEILALNVEVLDLERRRAPIKSKGGATEYVYWSMAPPACRRA